MEQEPEFTIGVNVSKIQLFKKDFHLKVAELLEEEQVNPANLILEMKEKFVAENIGFFLEKLEQLKEMEICQEGVETEEEFKRILKLGSEYIQGFYFGKPQSEDAITEAMIKAGVGDVFKNRD